MKKFYLTVVLAMIFSLNYLFSFSQGWEKNYGGDSFENGTSVQQTTDEGFIITGYTYSLGDFSDVYLIKTDINGDTLWTKTYGRNSGDLGYSVQQTSDGGYIITGGTYSSEYNYDVYLIKTNINGDTLWTKTYGGNNSDMGYSVQQTSDGGYIISGSTQSFGNKYSNVYLIKTDSIGIVLWTKTFGAGNKNFGFSVQQTFDEGYIVVGYAEYFADGESDVFLIKTDNLGDSIWTKTYEREAENQGESVQQTFDGGFIITGHTGPIGNIDGDVYLIRTDNNGDTLWTKTYGGEDHEHGYSVQQTTDEGFIITGHTQSFGLGWSDVYLIKTDNNGDTLWTKTYGGESSEDGFSVQQTTDGGYIISGSTYSFSNGENDIYLIKTDSEGNSNGITLIRDQISKETPEIYYSNGILYLSYEEELKGEIRIFNSSGHLLKITRLDKEHSKSIELSVVSGIYIVQLITEKKHWTKKVLIVK